MELVPISEDGSPAGDVPPSPMLDEVGGNFARYYGDIGFHPPWIGYFAVEHDHCVGSCSFKGPPSGDRVEISYFTFPEFEGGGVATRMASALVRIALEADRDMLVTARTQPSEGPSTAILRKLGFERMRTVRDPEDGDVWEWHLEDR